MIPTALVWALVALWALLMLAWVLSVAADLRAS